MKIAVLDAATLGRDLDLSPLSSLGEVRIFDGTAPHQVAAHIADADVAVVNKVRMNGTTLAGVRNLRLVCVAATGYDNVDLTYCRAKGVAVCNVAGYSTDSVAEITVAVVLSLTTHLPAFCRHVESGDYTRGGVANCLVPAYRELRGKTWGVAGYGNIGRAVGRVAEAFGCRLLVFRKQPAPGEPAVDLDTLCRESDILTVHLPLTDETRGIFDASAVAKLKPGAIFVNMARGAVADEKALADALLQGRLGGLGADVYTTEPLPETHPFYAIRDRDDVCLTPHMAWGAVEARERCLFEIVESIRAFTAGKRRSRVDV